MHTVELREAYVWTCDSCAHDNFGRYVMHSEKLDPDVNVSECVDCPCPDAMSEHAVSVELHTLVAPSEVTCSHCGGTFDTEIPDDCAYWTGMLGGDE